MTLNDAKALVLQVMRYGALVTLVAGLVWFAWIGELKPHDFCFVTCAILTLICQIVDHQTLEGLKK